MKDKKALLEELALDHTLENVDQIKRSYLLIGLFSLMVLAIGLFIYFQLTIESDAQQNNHTEPFEQVAIPSTKVAESSNITGVDNSNDVVLTASGYVVAKRIAKVSSEVTGRIVEILVDEGERVTTGQVVARLDNQQAAIRTALAKENVQAAKFEIISAKENLGEAERLMSRNRDLQKKGYVTEEHIVDLQTRSTILEIALEQATRWLKVAELELEAQKENLDDTVIVSPLSGVVVERTAQIGEIVSPIIGNGGFSQSGICTIIDMESLEIEVEVNESYIGRVKENHRVKATLDAYPDWDLEASVIAIVPTANRSKATVKVRIRILNISQYIDDEGRQILPEMGVRVEFLDKE